MKEDLPGELRPTARPPTDRRKSSWQHAARHLLRVEMAKHDYSYKSLAISLGGGETAENLMTRVSRGTFSFAFLLQALRAMGTTSLDISHLPRKDTPGADWRPKG